MSVDTDGNTRQLSVLTSTLASKTAEIVQRYDGIYDRAMKDAEIKEKEAYEKYSGVSSSNLQKYRDALQGRMDEMQKSVSGTMADLKAQTEDVRSSVEDALERLRSEFQESEKLSKLTASQVEDETQQGMQRLNAFTEAMNRQLAEFDEKVSQTMQGIASEYDAREAKFLSGIDQQLEDYKKEMEGRFKRLSATGGDVDKLEATLRSLVERSEKEVSGNLEKFTNDMTQKESSFEASMRESSQALATELAQLKAGVDELKNQAYMSTSANLKKFEDSF